MAAALELRHSLLTTDGPLLLEATTLAASAFQSTPSYAYMVPDDSGRSTFLRWLFERNFWLRLQTDCCRCTYDEATGDLISFFMFVKPSVPHPSLMDNLRAGLVGGAFIHGFGAVRRLLQTKSWFEVKQEEVLGSREAISLERMVVLPAYQGKGVGSRALSESLKEADALRLPCVLATQEERNVVFYGRLGFKVVDESVCDLGGYTNWMMVREPVIK